MSMQKKNDRRKALAIGLAVLGVAGLSVASASQLNLSAPSSVQAGAVDVDADCQPTAKTIEVAFAEPALSGGSYVSSSVNFSNVDEDCEERDFKVAFFDGSGGVLHETGGTVAGTTIIVPLGGAANQDNVARIALTIY